MPRLGVLGWPVAHSRSPGMHNAALTALGMAGWRYQRLPVPPLLLGETVRALRACGFAGANATIPHKRAVLAIADRASEAARAIGAVGAARPVPADLPVNCTSVGLEQRVASELRASAQARGRREPGGAAPQALKRLAIHEQALNQLALTLDVLREYSNVVDLV